MSIDTTHAQIVELLPAAALGILEPSQLESVLAHVQSCQECARELQAFSELVGSLALALPTHPLVPARAAHIRARLVTRTREAPSLPRGSRAIIAAERWSGWMVAAGLSALLLSHHAVHEPLSYGWIVAAILAVALIVLGVYARMQRKRIATLLKRLGERDPTPREADQAHPPTP